MDFMQIVFSLAVMNILSILIVVIIIFIDKVICNYGECKLTVVEYNERKEFSVPGGSNLLTVLNDREIEISSACGGKGICGYCKVKVTEGGGEVLPTEEVFLTYKEESEQMRMACQIKVRNDLTVVIPDYFAVIRNMVLHRKFNKNKRWKWTVH